MNSTYKFTAEISKEVYELEDAGLALVYSDNDTIEFNPEYNDAAIRFFETLPENFSRKVHTLLKVGEALGIITADQVADWKARRAEYENFIGEAFSAAKSDGKSEPEARKIASKSWENHKVETASDVKSATVEMTYVEIPVKDEYTVEEFHQIKFNFDHRQSDLIKASISAEEFFALDMAGREIASGRKERAEAEFNRLKMQYYPALYAYVDIDDAATTIKVR